MAKNFVLWAVIAAVLMMVFQGLNPVDRSNSWSYSEFMKAVEADDGSDELGVDLVSCP